jgi:acetolactate synthase-1/2/3 large subunit
VSEQSRTTAELIVECLENEGVTHVFGIPGEENIRFVDALSKSSIEYVLTRHEQGASFMAEVYGRLTGRAGVCSATLGPGAINLLLGVADATTNSTPLLAISAQVGMGRSYKESHQSIDLVSMFAPATKWSALVATPEAVPEMVRKAFKLAQTERPAARQHSTARRSVGRPTGACGGDSAHRAQSHPAGRSRGRPQRCG